MAHVFGAATSDIVNVGSVAQLDDMPAFTVAAWVYATTRTTGRVLFGKSSNFVFRLDGTSGNLQLLRNRATTNTSYITNSTPVALNSWVFVAATFDSAVGGAIFAGTLTAPVAECAYGTATAGSGSLTSDASASMGIGNRLSTNAWQGLIDFPAIWNRALGRAEIIQYQFQPWNVPLGAIGRWQLGGKFGTAVQKDLSGFANHGIVTGATATAITVPLTMPSRRRFYYAPAQAAAAAFNPAWARNTNTLLGGGFN